jgi:hypothetical protein
MTKKCRRYFRKLFDCAPIILGFQLVDDLDVEPEYATGVHKAIAKVAPFFLAPIPLVQGWRAFQEFLDVQSGRTCKGLSGYSFACV